MPSSVQGQQKYSFCLAGISRASPAWKDSTIVTLLHMDEVICLMPPTVKTNAEFQPRQQVPGPTLTPFPSLS